MSAEGVKYIAEYWSGYWQRIEEAKSFVPLEYMPEFLRSIKRIVVCDCRDGYVTLMYSGVGDMEISSYRSTRRALDVFGSQELRDSNGNKPPRNLRFDVVIEGSGSVHLAEPELILEQRPFGTQRRIFRTAWLAAHIIVKQEPSESLVDPTAQAERDVRTFAFARRLKVERSSDVGETRERVIAELEKLLKRFRALLEDASREQEVQDFIEENSFILAPFSELKDVRPKYPLGKELVTDLVIENKPPVPFSHTFVEIEPPSEPLFLKAKGHETKLTARANHAIEQLRDWRIWVKDNIAYIRRDFPSLDQCNYILIMGRGEGLSQVQRRKLAELNAEDNCRTVLTYDDIASKLEGLVANLRKLDEAA